MLSLFLAFCKIGLFCFGGGYAAISLIAREVVEVRGWLSMAELVDVVALSQATPGPIGVNAATYVGYKVMGFRGALAATTGVVVPPVSIMLALAFLFTKYRRLPAVNDFIVAIRPVVVALLISAVYSIASLTVTGILPLIVALGAFGAITWFRLDPILVLLLGGLSGLFLYM